MREITDSCALGMTLPWCNRGEGRFFQGMALDFIRLAA